MRATAEAKMQDLGLWKGKLPLTVYTIARYISSEVGSGTPEEKVAVAEAAVHRAKRFDLHDVNDLLLYRQVSGHPNRGWYGPVHSADFSAPYGRWASTSQDPGIDDLLIGNLVLTGKTKNFSQGADDQLGMDIILNRQGAAAVANTVTSNAARRQYWVGPLPGVNHWHTFLFKERSDVAPNSSVGQALVQRALNAVADLRQPDWSSLSICKPRLPVPVFVAVALAAGLGLAYTAAVYNGRT
ncbi:MAG: hypothetical protein A2583_03295 [Bdellovibrionales bacterium RIFOXYD1_FULL_53_11]|nr:MAG: hypothetical protein A2583_03295 [Bdellovibrionales bacterium RIFOXYD1_FULL_53_11]